MGNLVYFEIQPKRQALIRATRPLHMQEYLDPTEYTDWDEPIVLAQAKSLAADSTEDKAISRNCFDFVRDEIQHSGGH